MGTKQLYLGRFTLPATATDFTVDAVPSSGPYSISLDTGRYYTAGYTGESTDQLVETIQSKIQDVGAGVIFPTATVTLSKTTGLVSIDFGASGELVWSHTPLRDLLGFTTNLTSGSGYTATNQARYLWRPTVNPSDYSGDLAVWWLPRFTTRGTRSPDGTTVTVPGPAVLYDAEVTYTHLPEIEVITNSPHPDYQSLQVFFEDVIRNGMPFRVLPDQTSYTSTTYRTAVFAVEDEETGVGSFRDYVDRNAGIYNGRWKIRLPMWKHVGDE